VLRPGLHTDPRQPAPAVVAGAPAGIKLYPAFAEDVFSRLGMTQDAFFRLSWEVVDGRREGRSFRSVKLTDAELASGTHDPDFVAAVRALSAAVITSHYRAGYAEVHYVRIGFFSDAMQSSWHGDPAGPNDRHLQYFFAPTAGCFRAVQLAMDKGKADANRPALVAILGNGGLVSGLLSLRQGNGQGTGGADMLHQGMATAGCAGVWQMMFQTNVKLSALGVQQCGGAADEEAQLACARIAAPSPPIGPGAVATVKPETSRLISGCVSSTPGFCWWGNNWGYYGGNPRYCNNWLAETLPCILKMQAARPGLLVGYSAYKAEYRGADVEAMGCACMLPEEHALVAQATAAGDWYTRPGSTDPRNHAWQWDWYLTHATPAHRRTAAAAER